MNQSAFYQINRNPVNNSKSKQLYSFPKATRFNYKTKPMYHQQLLRCSQSFYDIHDPFASKKNGTTFGYGTKVDFSKLTTTTPGPNVYRNEVLKKQSYCKSQCYMGAGRVYAKQRDVVPPPGKYEIPSTLSKTAYTMRPRLEPKIGSLSPGPGKYQIELKPSAPSVFIDTKQARYNRTPEIYPGPTHYNPNIEMSPNGKHSIYQNQGATKFSKEPRFHTVGNDQPGPGYYQLPGEFGIY